MVDKGDVPQFNRRVEELRARIRRFDFQRKQTLSLGR